MCLHLLSISNLKIELKLLDRKWMKSRCCTPFDIFNPIISVCMYRYHQVYYYYYTGYSINIIQVCIRVIVCMYLRMSSTLFMFLCLRPFLYIFEIFFCGRNWFITKLQSTAWNVKAKKNISLLKLEKSLAHFYSSAYKW